MIFLPHFFSWQFNFFKRFHVLGNFQHAFPKFVAIFILETNSMWSLRGFKHQPAPSGIDNDQFPFWDFKYNKTTLNKLLKNTKLSILSWQGNSHSLLEIRLLV